MYKFLLTILLVIAPFPNTISAKGQGPDQPGRPERSDYRGPGSHSRSRPPHDRRETTVTLNESVVSELVHIPALDRHLRRIFELQEQRFELQGERIAMAGEPGKRERISDFKRFHALLRQDEGIADRQKEVLRQIKQDSAAISEQIMARKGTLQARAKEVTSASLSIQLRRQLRFYTFLEERLESIRRDPNRPDQVYRLLRGFRRGFDEEEDDPQERMIELRRSRRELQSRLNEVEEELQDLETLTSDTATPAPRRDR